MIKLLYKLLGYYRLKTKKNFGLILGTPGKKMGDITDWEVLQLNGQWDKFLPDYEYQRFAWGDVMACVTYSFLNCLETLFKRKYNETRDFSDRFTAKISGTTYDGNTMSNVLNSFSKLNGFVSWFLYRNESMSWANYYQPIPEKVELSKGNLVDIKALALENLKYFDIKAGWIEPTNPEKLKEALKYSPLWVAIYAYGEKVNGVYQRIEGLWPNHCVMIYGWDDNGNWKVFDHYLGAEHRLLAPNYLIGYAQKLFIEKV